LVYQNEFAARYQDAVLPRDRCFHVRYEGDLFISVRRAETYYGSITAPVRNVESIGLWAESGLSRNWGWCFSGVSALEHTRPALSLRERFKLRLRLAAKSAITQVIY